MPDYTCHISYFPIVERQQLGGFYPKTFSWSWNRRWVSCPTSFALSPGASRVSGSGGRTATTSWRRVRACPKADREMVALVVSAANDCLYCMTSHGYAVRVLLGEPGRRRAHHARLPPRWPGHPHPGHARLRREDHQVPPSAPWRTSSTFANRAFVMRTSGISLRSLPCTTIPTAWLPPPHDPQPRVSRPGPLKAAPAHSRVALKRRSVRHGSSVLSPESQKETVACKSTPRPRPSNRSTNCSLAVLCPVRLPGCRASATTGVQSGTVQLLDGRM